MAPSIRYLSTYLLGLERTRCRKHENNRSRLWECQELPWNGSTCLAVICYVRKHLSTSDYNIIVEILWYLNDAAREHAKIGRIGRFLLTPWRIEKEISQIIVNSFIPEVRRFFSVPKLQDLRDTDKFLKPNEILASFMVFLVEILSCESSNSLMISDFGPFNHLRRELTFLLAFLGDTPFECTELQEVSNLLTEFETFANEAGSFIYLFLFSTCHVLDRRFIEDRNALSRKLELLHTRINDHCIEFSSFYSGRYLTSKTTCADSLFIIDSLLRDLDNFTGDGVANATYSEIMDLPLISDEFTCQMKILVDELMMSRTLLRNLEESEYESTYELRECVVQIRDATYEAEYLINSLSAEKLPIWYVLLRLPGISQKIQLSRLRCQESKTTLYECKVLKLTQDMFEVALTTKANDLVVGFDGIRTTILSHLTGVTASRQIISIFGMPGLGKTTLSRNLYDDPLVHYHFHIRAWCVVSQTYQRRKVLLDILLSLTSGVDKQEILKLDDDALGLKIHQNLSGRRYLIVIDDIWSLDAWDDLKRFFPDQGIGSRIILTSRIKYTAPPDSISETLPLLSESQSFYLLAKKVFQNEPCPPQLQTITSSIATKCRGLPLAIVVMAGILSNLEQEESVWEKIETNLESYISDDSSECTKVFELSYDHLPNHLKLCFLYFGAFHEDEEIPLRKLTWLWIGEGFISSEQVAEECLLELIGRSLVFIAKRSSYGGIKTCSIHDLLREMCLRRCYEWGFFKFRKEYSIFEKNDRVWDHSTTTTELSPFGLHCRSLSGSLLDPSSYLLHMPLLRVVDQFLGDIFGFRPPLRITGCLIHLRYLSVNVMPYEIEDFQYPNLKFLNVRFGCQIPSSIFKMANLKHLRFTSSATFSSGIPDTTNNLESIGYVSIEHHQDEEILKKSPYLRKLKCRYSEIAFPDFGFHNNLESLTIRYNSYPGLDAIKSIKFPSCLRKLSLKNVYLSLETMSIIGSLPNLHVLKLVGDAFMEEKWETMDGEFEELRFLKLEDNFLRNWTTSSEHFPKLQTLLLNRCPEMLQEIPGELGYNPSLKKIEVRNCSYEASLSAVQIEEEQRDNGNEDLQVIIASDTWSKEELIRNSRDESCNEAAEEFLPNSIDENSYGTAGELLQNCEELQPIATNTHRRTVRTRRGWYPNMGKMKWKRLCFS